MRFQNWVLTRFTCFLWKRDVDSWLHAVLLFEKCFGLKKSSTTSKQQSKIKLHLHINGKS